MTQLPLAFRLETYASFDTFVAAAGSPAPSHARSLAGSGGGMLWLWGAAGCGKTHLLQAACRHAGDAGRRAMYVPLGSAEIADPGSLRGLETLELLALDDVDRVSGDIGWERALFGVLDAFQARERCLMMAAQAPPAGAGLVLADLASRAAAAVVYRLEPLDEEERVLALVRHARHRGLELEEPAARFLLNRVQRDMKALCAWLERLDREALAAKRRLTIPFIRAMLSGSAAS